MAMKRCPVCGEKYSDTYRDCPFCEEEEALLDGEEIRRSPKRGRRAAHGRQYNLITPTLIVLILIMAGLLVYLLYGDKLAAKFGKDEDADPTLPTENVIPVNPDTQEPDDQTQPEDPDGVMPGNPDGTTEPSGTTDTPTTPTVAQTDYDKAMALPSGLGLSTTDFTLKLVGETATIKVTSGGSGSYTWASEDEGIASVDQNGKVTAISKGTVNIVVSDGNKKGVCIVRCNLTGSVTTTPATNTGDNATSGGSGLKAGAAVVVNGGNGVRVRSGPGTNYDILASVPNGADIQIVESAGDGWYKITFSDVGGATTPGYMKGEFLANK